MIEEEGFACAAELLAKLSRMGMRVEEVPVRLDWTRRAGKSKMPVAATVLGYWRMLLRARAAGEPASGEPRVAIVGAGILGMSAAYRLAQAGVSVAVFERLRDLGGLVGSFDLDGHPVDRFYHVILPTDDRVIGLAEELGLGGRFRFRPTKVGFYGDGRLFSMTSPMEFLRFPLFGPADRARLASFVVRCQMTTSYERPRRRAAPRLARATSGRRVTERLWKPLLDSKFDGRYDDLPATYIWARSRRMATTRDRSGREVMGWIEGGYQTLIDALERRIRELGGKVHAGTAVSRSSRRTDGAPPASSPTAASSRRTSSSPRSRRPRRGRSSRPTWRPASGPTTAATSASSASCCAVQEREPVLPPEHHRPDASR